VVVEQAGSRVSQSFRWPHR